MLPIWMLNMDIRKTFDTIDHWTLIQRLRSTRLSDEYIFLLSLLHIHQSESVNRSSAFAIRRIIKHDDTFNAILFNYVLDTIFDI